MTLCRSFLFLSILMASLQVNADGRNKVSLMVLVDMSSSMAKHRDKLAQISDIVERSLEKATCDFNVAVTNIAYKDLGYRDHFEPWAEPGGEPWLSMSDENAPQLIKNRIRTPEETVFPYSDGDQMDDAIPSNSKERTYSSVVESMRYNQKALAGSVAVGTVLFSDAAPGYELYSPQQAAQEIKNILGGVPYMTANIVSELYPGIRALDPRSRCAPDWPKGQLTNQVVKTDFWDSPNLNGINEFNDLFFGTQINVCAPSYEDQLQRFLIELLSIGDCLLIA